MNLIDVGDAWHPASNKQDNAARLVLKKVGKKKKVEIRTLMMDLREIYDQKKDRKDLLKNLSRSSNHPVVIEKEEMKIGRLRKQEYKVKK